MSNMKEAMKSQTNTEFEAAMIKQKMEKLFLQDREGENRYGLHASAIIAGADPNNVYGNEFNEEVVEIARERLGTLGVPWYHIHQGDARKKEAILMESFTEDYVPDMTPIEKPKKSKSRKKKAA